MKGKRRFEMQVPQKFYFVVRKYKDGHEDTDGMEFNTKQEAEEYLLHIIKNIK